MKKIKKIVLAIALTMLLIVCAGMLFACGDKAETTPQNITIDGDILGNYKTVNLNEIEQTSYSYFDKDKNMVTGIGWDVNKLLAKITPLYSKNSLLISGKDGTCASLPLPLSDKVYIYILNGVYNSKAPNYPPVTGIKDIAELTLVASQNPTLTTLPLNGEATPSITVTEAETKDDALDMKGRALITRGNAKMMLYKQEGGNGSHLENYANKYTLKSEGLSVSSFAKYVLSSENEITDCIAYFEDSDIRKSSENLPLVWSRGSLACKITATDIRPLGGVVTATNTLVTAVYDEMKASIDGGEKVLFILTDGFSYAQSQRYASELTALSPTSGAFGSKTRAYKYAASTAPAKSEVALAAMLSGKTPKYNGVTKRGEHIIKCEDIFNYAKDKSKSSAYFEGSSNLIYNLSFAAELSLSDKETYEKAEASITKGDEVIVVHFHEIDDKNHKFGTNSAQSIAKIKEIDGYIAKLVDAFDGKVIVSSDHGQFNYKDASGENKGNHATFTNFDMYVPFYIFK